MSEGWLSSVMLMNNYYSMEIDSDDTIDRIIAKSAPSVYHLCRINVMQCLCRAISRPGVRVIRDSLVCNVAVLKI